MQTAGYNGERMVSILILSFRHLFFMFKFFIDYYVIQDFSQFTNEFLNNFISLYRWLLNMTVVIMAHLAQSISDMTTAFTFCPVTQHFHKKKLTK